MGAAKGPRKRPSGAQERRKHRERLEAAGVTLPRGGPVPPMPEDFTACNVEGEGADAAYAEAIAYQRLAMRKSVTVDGATASALERTARIAASLVKSVDPKRQLEERDAALRQASEDIAELEQRVRGSDAIQEHPPGNGGPGAPTEH